uniref:Uncharacterized protein n=1 Tax=Anguilla anguilla TaxID=7936 RepID=A0A0E9S582_ANGAN
MIVSNQRVSDGTQLPPPMSVFMKGPSPMTTDDLILTCALLQLKACQLSHETGNC